MTHDSQQDPTSLGHPCLIFSMGGIMSTHVPQRRFYLVDGVTTIGSAPDSDLCLTGLEPHHAEIRLDGVDDYTYVPLGMATGGSVDGRPDRTTVLRTGSRIALGPWTVSFYREEMSDKSVGGDTTYGVRFTRMRDDATNDAAAIAHGTHGQPGDPDGR